MDTKEIELFEKVNAQLYSLHEEISILSKKSPNDGLNKFKLKFVNSVLQETNTILSKKYKPFADFVTFSEDELPNNGDVVFILAQYLACMENLRADNIERNIPRGGWYWKNSQIKTAPPQKLEGK